MFSHSGHVMTLANSIIGVGILAMPFCFQKCGIILSILLLILSNWITRVCCHYLIKTSLLTRRKSFELLGLHAFGTSGKLLAELCIIGYLIGTCITYFVVVGDLGPQIVAKLFTLEIAEHKHLRTVVMLLVTACCIIPLGMLRNVDSLSAVCTASIGFYVCLMLKIVLESETHIVANDWTQQVVYWRPAGVLQCLPIFSMALSCQMQLFGVFDSINNQSLDKLNGIVRNATWICTLVYIAVGFFGYVAFCTQSFSGNILINLSPSFGSDIIKIGFVLSIAFSFPLVIFPCRASIYSLLYRKHCQVEMTSYIPEQRFRWITVFIVVSALCVALAIPSVELIIGLIGSTIGVAICIMFPASSFRKIIRKESAERTLAQFVFVSGFCLMILGTYANLNAIDAQGSGPQLDLLPAVSPLTPNAQPMPVVNAKYKPEIVLQPKEEPKEALIKQVLEKLEDSKPIKQMEKIEKPQIVAVSTEKPKAMPPLPVDEPHVEPPVELPAVAKIEPVPKPEVAAEAISLEKRNLTLPKVEAPKLPPPPPQPQAVVEMPQIPAAQTIDGAAIKKEEEITAEEQKDNKGNTDELRKTNKELVEKMHRLERTMDEINEELSKQKPQNQNQNALAADKADIAKPEVVQDLINKLKEIKSPMEPPPKPAEPQPAGPQPQAVKPVSLMDMLTENAHAREEQEAHAGVFEPLSYKRGELQNKNVTNTGDALNLVQRLPLPLALLANTTQLQNNNSLNADPPANKTSMGNVEAIRRELLEFKQAPKETTEQLLLRVKREQSCLPEPQLLDVGVAGLKIENMGRELKSVQDEEPEELTTTITTTNKVIKTTES
ncbi:CG30394 [Drosophila busckii]|uniref:CG30394 n=1 Tax=Drosophila busckii TaxID=30019 RepID=A0A0M4E9P3_DROBS|nr:putative sodium-coupled neutral amino acid transporter 10 [Drosophila busckii]XP_017839896.1 putative sodium-coupled neutral amino acid transporter 10 [Drosophila busckii]ALC41671.1 CG30394 [Drosophila busckii]